VLAVLKRIQAKAREKAASAPRPSKAEADSANKEIDRVGADRYESNIRGNSTDRASSRQRLLDEFGDGKHCPCCYCGMKLDKDSVSRDKIYTAREGGRYRQDNLLPACLGCNQSRGDVKFKNIQWPS
jgi:hypothetical protein